MTITLRPYQQEAVDAIYNHFETSDDNCLVVIPTAGGKTPILTSFLSGAIGSWPETRVLCLVHVKELLDQAFKTLLKIWPTAPASIYSAGLKSKNLKGQIVFATIQSIFKKAYSLQRVDLVIVDEVDMIPHGSDGMYRKLLADLIIINPMLKVVGLTATPWRLSSGLITEGKDALFKSIAYEVSLDVLLGGKYICPPIAKTMDTQIDTRGVSVRGGEFVAAALEKAADKHEITEAAVREMVRLGSDRKSWLVFCSGVYHAYHVRDEFKAHGITCESITGETPSEQRARFIEDYKAGRIRCLTNCGVLTVGFDSPRIDMIGILRPTKSARLWVQILGRGFRLSPETGKTDFMVLDYTSNSRNFGPIDLLRPKSKMKANPGELPAPHKICPECEAEILISSRECLACGYVFPPPKAQIKPVADVAPILSSQIVPEEVRVTKVTYHLHQKPDKPPTLRADYWCGLVRHSEWICLEHSGYPRQKACQWWTRRAPGMPVPNTVEEALSVSTVLPVPTSIQIKQVGKFVEILRANFA